MLALHRARFIRFATWCAEKWTTLPNCTAAFIDLVRCFFRRWGCSFSMAAACSPCTGCRMATPLWAYSVQNNIKPCWCKGTHWITHAFQSLLWQTLLLRLRIGESPTIYLHSGLWTTLTRRVNVPGTRAQGEIWLSALVRVLIIVPDDDDSSLQMGHQTSIVIE